MSLLMSPFPSQGRETDSADVACGLPWPFAWLLGLQTNMGPCPQGKTSYQNSQGTRGRFGEGGSSGQALAISFPLQALPFPR